MKIRNISIVLAAMAASSGVSFSQSLSINGVISQTVGTTASIPGNTSGTSANTTTFATGTAGVFSMTNGVTTSYMRVSTSNPTGSLVVGRDALMVARTVNSQGLLDTGTLSIYVRPATAGNANIMATGRWTLDTRFEFFSDIGLTTRATTNLLLTSLDIDFNQRYYTDNTDFSSNVRYGTPGNPTQVTTLTSPNTISGFSGFTSSGNGAFNDQRFAVGSAGNQHTFDIKLGHDNLALFMFEFRNPSQVIPEPSSAILMTAGLSMLCLNRRRRVA